MNGDNESVDIESGELSPRDHRVLGRRLGLFTLDEEVGLGLPLWKPAGAVVRQALCDFITELLHARGYQPVYTPHIGHVSLYRTSGHFPYYAASQYPPIVSPAQLRALGEQHVGCGELGELLARGDIEGYLLKPMNCPHHIHIYKSEPRSYRDLPIRYCEFGTVYRFEQSGELCGMTRVRALTVDDAHIFCRPEQAPEELDQCLELVRIVFETLGISRYRVRVGLRDPDDPKFVGDAADWERAQATLLEAAQRFEPNCSVQPGDAAFYGPKIDFVVRDVLDREWQLGTIQLDHTLPERFGLSYTDRDGSSARPVMIHRAPLGSLERFVALLTEHFAGAFPLWLAPLQARILPVSDRFTEHALEVQQRLRRAGLRVDVEARGARLPARIRSAVEAKIPYVLVVGEREQAADTLSVRARGQEHARAMPVAEFAARAAAQAQTRALAPTALA